MQYRGFLNLLIYLEGSFQQQTFLVYDTQSNTDIYHRFFGVLKLLLDAL